MFVKSLRHLVNALFPPRLEDEFLFANKSAEVSGYTPLASGSVRERSNFRKRAFYLFGANFWSHGKRNSQSSVPQWVRWSTPPAFASASVEWIYLSQHMCGFGGIQTREDVLTGNSCGNSPLSPLLTQ
jgi:hypothetical protein